MRGVSMPKVVEPKVRDARLPARRSKAMLDVPDVNAAQNEEAREKRNASRGMSEF